jgi:transcription termination factor Rho
VGRRRSRRKKRSRGRNNNGDKIQRLSDRLNDYTPIQPEERIRMETTSKEKTGRVLDLITPIGKGQRVLVTSPPKAGKTTILQKIARAVDKNHPDIELVALLVDERPEEATDFRRNIPCDVRASTTDRSPKEHIRLAEKVMIGAVEKVLEGKDVLVLMDSLTRLARAYNATSRNSGRTLSGGVSAGALDRPRQLFGLARNLEEGGSLTVVASALIETGSRMDDVIFQEFKGTGNSEIVLSRDLSRRRIWPALDVGASGSRRENKLFDEIEADRVPRLRRKTADMGTVEAIEWILGRVGRTDSNRELLGSIR